MGLRLTWKPLRRYASTLVAAVLRLREAEKWIEWYCTTLLGIAASKAAAVQVAEPVILPDTPSADTSRTRSSRAPDPNARASGYPERISPNDDLRKVRGITRQNQAADILARHGYRVHHQPQVPGAKEPDYLIEGKIFDCLAPTTSSARNIAD